VVVIVVVFVVVVSAVELYPHSMVEVYPHGVEVDPHGGGLPPQHGGGLTPQRGGVYPHGVEVDPHGSVTVSRQDRSGRRRPDPEHEVYNRALRQAACAPDFLWRCVDYHDPAKETGHLGFHPGIIRAIRAPTSSFDMAHLTWIVVLPCF